MMEWYFISAMEMEQIRRQFYIYQLFIYVRFCIKIVGFN